MLTTKPCFKNYSKVSLRSKFDIIFNLSLAIMFYKTLFGLLNPFSVRRWFDEINNRSLAKKFNLILFGLLNFFIT